MTNPQAPPLPLPPSNAEAERGVIGSVLIDPPAYDLVAPIVRAEDFYHDDHRIIWGHIGAMRSAGAPADYTTLAESLRKAGVYDRVGGVDRLHEISRSVPHSANAEYYARIVREKAMSRQLAEAAAETLREVYANRLSAEQLLAGAEARILAVGNRGVVRQAWTPTQVIDGTDRALEARSHGELPGVPTGLVDLDHILGGCLVDGTLTIIAGRPAMGKSAIGLRICEHAAVNLGVPTLLISLEMGLAEIGERLYAGMSGIDGPRLRSNRGITPAERDGLDAARRRIAAGGLHIDDAPTRSMASIASVVRRMRVTHKIALVVVDYVQLIAGTGEGDRGANRQEVVSAISAGLKELARECNIPVVAMAQLNRGVEQRENKRPLMSDLRESGALENDAHVVMLLYRADYYKADDSPGVAEVIVSKNRNGSTGTAKLAWCKELTRFDNVETRYDKDYF